LRGGLLQTRQTVGSLVVPRQLGHRLAGRIALGDLAALTGVELGRAPE